MPKPQVPVLWDRRDPASAAIAAADVAGALRRYAVRESTGAAALAAPVKRTVVEASTGTATVTKPGRILARLIRAGWSLNSNHYGAAVLREAGNARVFRKGTHAYADHASAEDEAAHPSGSLKNLAGVLATDAWWDESEQALMAEVRLFAPWREAITDMAESIGMSIRAWVTGDQGETDGQSGFVVDKLLEARSVDFVTVPAAGGAIISVLEAVGNTVPVAEARNAGHWFEANIHSHFSRMADEMFGEGLLTREERITLSSAVGDALAAFAARIEQDAAHLYSRDPYAGPPEAPEPVAVTAGESEAAEPETPQDETSTPPAAGEAEPSVTDGAPPPAPETPPNEPEEEPVSGSQTGAPPEQAGTATVPDTVPPTTAEAAPSSESIAAIIAEAVRAATAPLTQQIADLSARESERDAAVRADRNRQTAAEAITTALQAVEHTDVAGSITSRVNSRVTAAVPTTAEGAVDTTALGELISAVIADEANHVRRERANALAEAGVGLPYGMGGAPAEESTEDDGLDAQLEAFFSGSLGMNEQAAKIAARGRGV